MVTCRGVVFNLFWKDLFILGCVGSSLPHGLFSLVEFSGDPSPVVVPGLLIVAASLVAELGL